MFSEHFNDLEALKQCKMEFIGAVHLIKNQEGTTVGVIDYRVLKSIGDIYIEIIEVFEDYQNQGYATETIRLIKDKYPNSRIFGQLMPNETTKNIWISIGATFGSCYDEDCQYNSFEECRHHCGSPADYAFGI